MTGLSSVCTIVNADSDEGRPMAVVRDIIFSSSYSGYWVLRSAGSVDDSRSVILVDAEP